MKIENKTNEEIKAHIVKMCDSYNKTGKDLYLKIKEECEAELQRRAQKKSVEPSENQGQLPDMEQRRERENKTAWYEERREKAKANEPEKIRELSGNYQGETRVIGTVTAAPIITVPVVEIALSSGTKQMNRTEIMTMLKTWFKRVATSKAMEEGRFSDAYGGSMGQDTYKLFQGWNVIYNETKEGAAWPPLVDVFPGLSRASQQQKINAEILWRWASNDK